MEDPQVDLVVVTLSAKRRLEIDAWLVEVRGKLLDLADEFDQAFLTDRSPMVKAHKVRAALDDLRLALQPTCIERNKNDNRI